MASRRSTRSASLGGAPTAIAVNLDQTVTDCLRQTRGLVVVLSDQHLSTSDPRIVQIVPDAPAPAVAITLLAARALPRRCPSFRKAGSWVLRT